MASKMVRAVVAFGWLACGVAAQQSASVEPRETPPDSVLRLIDLAGLPRLTPNVVCRQFASTDPNGRGDDHGHFLKLDGKRALLAEMEGPGVIARLWSANAAGRLKIYLDGETTPRIDAPFQDLFTSKCAPFVEPIALHAGGGWISYFPIPYAKHCRVEVDELEHPGELYYQVQYLTYPAGTAMRTFTRELPESEHAALANVLEVWRDPEHHPAQPPIPERQRELARASPAGVVMASTDDAARRFVAVVGGKEIPAASDSASLSLKGQGIIEFVRLDMADPTPEKLRGVVLSIQFDDASGPSVEVPIGDFFGVGFGPRPVSSLFAGWGEHGGYCRLPMPFRKGATLTLHNHTAAPVQLFLDVNYDSFASPQTALADAGYFHAEYRNVDQVGDDLYSFAHVEGSGKFIGVNLTLQGVGDLWYLEGNEEISVDGEAKPSIVGTGTEDFFNGGWYWDSGPLSLPLNGLGVKEEWTTNRTTPRRHFLPDAVPFRSHFVGKIEHGSSNCVRDASYSSVAFWYALKPEPVHHVAAEDARLPRQWVRRPKGALPAVSMKWSPAEAMTPTRWEAVSSGYRGCDYSLYQGFPVSHFERDQPKVAPELALLRGREVHAAFVVDEGDRYRLRLLFARHPSGPKFTALIDDQPLSLADGGSGDSLIDSSPDSATAAGAPLASVAPFLSPPFAPIGLARGEHQLALRIDPSSAANAESAWIGLDAIALESAAPFVKSWWIGPPVECDPHGTVEQIPAAEPPLLAPDFDPATAHWKETPDAGDVADLNHWVTSRAPIFGYLLTYVNSPVAQTVRARLGSDDGVRVWCNGALAWSHALHRPITVDADHFDVPLHQGWNTLLVKVKNDDGGYAVSLRLADPTGKLAIATRKDGR